MSDSTDEKLQLKKRARRRLVGSAAFAGLVAVILPMVLDEEPRQPLQEVQIHIPGENQTPFAPDATAPSTPEKPKAAEQPSPVASAPDKSVKSGENLPKSIDKSAEKPTEKPQTKAEKPEEKLSPARLAEMKRAEDILNGRFPSTGTTPPANAAKSEANIKFVILIGAFSNPANVKQLQKKFGEIGVKTFTEPFESPEGNKTRLRAGPFPTKDAAAKALGKMKQIGVNGVISTRQE